MLSRLIHHHGLVLIPSYGVQYVRSKIYSFLISKSLFRCGKRINSHYSSRILGVNKISLGDDFFSGPGLWMEAVTRHQTGEFDPSIVIGDRVAANSNVHIACINRITIGSDVLLASNIFISDHNHGRYSGNDAQSDPATAPNNRPIHSIGPVEIGNNCWIGENVAILPGSKIGSGSIVGANSVVRSIIQPNSIVAGSPARVIKSFDPNTNKWMPAS